MLVGLLALATFAMHGCFYLHLKTEGELQSRIHKWMWTSFGCFLVLYLFTTVFTLVEVPLATRNFTQILALSPGAFAAALLTEPNPVGALVWIPGAVWLLARREVLVNESYLERFKLALDVGFQALEAQTVPDPKEADQIKEAAEKAGLRIHSVMNMDHWKYPLSSADPAVVELSMKGMETSLRNAKLWGADAVLLVPAVVNPQTTIESTQIKGSMKLQHSLMTVSAEESGTRMQYRLEVIPSFLASAVMSEDFLKHEIEEQFTAIIGEMVRRKSK